MPKLIALGQPVEAQRMIINSQIFINFGLLAQLEDWQEGELEVIEYWPIAL